MVLSIKEIKKEWLNGEFFKIFKRRKTIIRIYNK
jgi:hypothetical protein